MGSKNKHYKVKNYNAGNYFDMKHVVLRLTYKVLLFVRAKKNIIGGNIEKIFWVLKIFDMVKWLCYHAEYNGYYENVTIRVVLGMLN